MLAAVSVKIATEVSTFSQSALANRITTRDSAAVTPPTTADWNWKRERRGRARPVSRAVMA